MKRALGVVVNGVGSVRFGIKPVYVFKSYTSTGKSIVPTSDPASSETTDRTRMAMVRTMIGARMVQRTEREAAFAAPCLCKYRRVSLSLSAT